MSGDGGRLKVAVLYSGRFLGPRLMSYWIQNQLAMLIVPNNASVFVVVSEENWCHVGAEALAAANASRSARVAALLRQDVRAAFSGWPHLHVSLLPQNRAGTADDSRIIGSVTSLVRRACASKPGCAWAEGALLVLLRLLVLLKLHLWPSHSH